MNELKHKITKSGGTVHLTLEGEIDLNIAAKLRKILHGIISERPKELIVDMQAVPFIDSSGIATLVEALRLQMKDQRVLRIEKATDPVRYTFRITQLGRIFGMEDPEPAAKPPEAAG